MENLFFDKKDLKYCGTDVIIGKTVRIRKPENVIIMDHVIIDDFTYIAPSMEIGSYVHIAPNCTFIGGMGFVKIGDAVGISAGSRIIAASSDYRGGALSNPTIPTEIAGVAIVGPICIKNYALLGVNTVVLPGVAIPEGMATGALTLVKKQIYKTWTLYGGNPIKELGIRDKEAMLRSSRQLGI